ncbi:MAG: hypothetical protein LBJ09_02025 [Clostridiales bacterium]|jgi:hypothetical protein|nr:hypothetical protein [Clostridiales bacterium]
MVNFKRIEEQSNDTEFIKDLIRQQNKPFYKMIFQFIICLFFIPVFIIFLLLHFFEKDYLFFKTCKELEEIKEQINLERKKIKEIDFEKFERQRIEKLKDSEPLNSTEIKKIKSSESSNLESPSLNTEQPESVDNSESSNLESPVLNSQESKDLRTPDISFVLSEQFEQEKLALLDGVFDKVAESIRKEKTEAKIKKSDGILEEIEKNRKLSKSISKLYYNFIYQTFGKLHHLKANLKVLLNVTFPNISKDSIKEIFEEIFIETEIQVRNFYITIGHDIGALEGMCAERMARLENESKIILVNMQKAKEGDEKALAFLAEEHVEAPFLFSEIDEEKLYSLINNLIDSIIQNQKARVEEYRKRFSTAKPAMPFFESMSSETPVKKATVHGK